jgi:putative membrane protein
MMVSRFQLSLCKIALVGAASLLSVAVLRAQDPTFPDPMSSPTSVSPAQNAARTQPALDRQDSTGGWTDPQNMEDKQFLHKASEGGVAEVELAKLALQKSSNDGVKAFAQKIIDDHTSLNDSMKPIAESLGVLPAKRMSKTDQAEYDKLNALSKDDFDKAYITCMVKDHRQDLHEFREEAATAEDPALKDASMKGARVIHRHLGMIQKLAVENGVPVPPHAPPAPGA